MDYDIGLRKKINSLTDFRKYSLNDLKTLSFNVYKSKIEKHLIDFSGIDVDCNSTHPLFLGNEENTYVQTYDNEIVFFNIVFSNEEKVEFHKCEGKKLTFSNCIFISYFYFTQNPESVSFDNCCFRNLVLNIDDCKDFYITCSIIERLKIYSAEFKRNKLTVSNTEIGSLLISDVDSNKFSFIMNKIYKISLDRSVCNYNFDYRQLNCFSTGTVSIKKKSLFELVDYNSNNSDNIVSTLNFLQSLNILKEDAQFFSMIEFVKNKKIKRCFLHKIILEIFGYFMNPTKIFLKSLLLILLYSIIYLFLDNKENCYAPILNSFYSFLGSIPAKQECTLVDFICITEAFFGFLFTNAFIISLGKKYLK